MKTNNNEIFVIGNSRKKQFKCKKMVVLYFTKSSNELHIFVSRNRNDNFWKYVSSCYVFSELLKYLPFTLFDSKIPLQNFEIAFTFFLSTANIDLSAS